MATTCAPALALTEQAHAASARLFGEPAELQPQPLHLNGAPASPRAVGMPLFVQPLGDLAQ